MPKKKPQKELIQWPGGLGSPESFEIFRKMVADYNANHNTPELAREGLVRAGILTKTGRLSKRFR